ncbi:MAG: hypothetical protein LIR46_09350 [Bacteroidota bacterium]|nr:hypothetical protein [Bacteroidota bacterium]
MILVIKARIMLGDADGDEEDDYDIPFEEWDYLKEWWDAYFKKYPDLYYKDYPKNEKGIYPVGYEYNEGSWKVGAINEIFKVKGDNSILFDHDWSLVDITVSDEECEFVNGYEDIDEEPEGWGEDLFDTLLMYASYWYRKGKTDDALIEIPTVW